MRLGVVHTCRHSWPNTFESLSSSILDFNRFLIGLPICLAFGALFVGSRQVLVAAPGDVDTSFGKAGLVTIHPGPAAADEWAHSIVVQLDAKILVGGYVNAGYGLVRYNSDGTLDANFGSGGAVVSRVSYDSFTAIALQSDAKIVVGGATSFDAGPFRFSVVRHTPNGSLDQTFGGSGNVITSFGGAGDFATDLVVQSDGKVVLAGYSEAGADRGFDQDFALARYNIDGSLDSTFNGDGKLTTNLGDTIDRCMRVALQSDGKILAAGYSGSSLALLRYNLNGSLDTTFHGDGKLFIPASSGSFVPLGLAAQSDGKILLAGTISDRFALVRLAPEGNFDTNFGVNGRVSSQLGPGWASCGTLALQLDGKIVAAGIAGVGSIGHFALVRYLANGDVDRTFGTNGIVITKAGSVQSGVARLALQPDGRILAAGRVWNGTYSDFGVVRYLGDAAPTINLQPTSQIVTVGETATFEVGASGTSPLYYQWQWNGTNIDGANSAILSLTKVDLGSAGVYSALVSNYLGSVASSNAVLRINRPPIADASATRQVILSVNNSNATTVLDGSRSSDPDGDALTYQWFIADTGAPIASGAAPVVTLPLGTNSLILEVNEAWASDTDSVTVLVLSPAHAIHQLQADVEASDLSLGRKRQLGVDLVLAEKFLGFGKRAKGVNYLERFKEKVLLLVAPREPELSKQWLAQAQLIIDALRLTLDRQFTSTTGTNPDAYVWPILAPPSNLQPVQPTETPKKQTSAQVEVTPYHEPTLFLPSSLTQSLFDNVEITHTVTNSFHWDWTTPLMIELHAPYPSRASDPFPFQYPQTSYRPEYLIDTR